jgi:hypothetical protein
VTRIPPASPRGLSRSQRRVIDTHGVTLVGFDDAGRPVVERKATWGENVERWSVTKTGEPVDVRGKVTKP